MNYPKHLVVLLFCLLVGISTAQTSLSDLNRDVQNAIAQRRFQTCGMSAWEKQVKEGLLDKLSSKEKAFTLTHACLYLDYIRNQYLEPLLEQDFLISLDTHSSRTSTYTISKNDTYWRLSFVTQKNSIITSITRQSQPISPDSIQQRRGAYPVIVYQATQRDVYYAVLSEVGKLAKVPASRKWKESKEWSVEASDPSSGYIRLSATADSVSCKEKKPDKKKEPCEVQRKYPMVISVTDLGEGFTKVTISQYTEGQEAVDGLVRNLNEKAGLGGEINISPKTLTR